MRPVLLLLVALPACDAGDRSLFGCPADEDCSDVTPSGLHFLGPGLAGEDLTLPPLTTAVGGTQEIELAETRGTVYVPLAAPYTAVLDTDALEVAGAIGATVTMRGIGTGSGKLKIVDSDGLLMDQKTFDAAELTDLSIVGDHFESTDLPLAFLAGTFVFGVALEHREAGTSTRLVDQSMALDLAGAVHLGWDTLEVTAPVGTQTVTVSAAGGPPTTLDVTVVAGVDQLIDHPPELGLQAGQLGVVCFDARSGTRHVAGLSWSFTGDNGDATQFLTPNCAILVPDHEGTITLTADVAGLHEVVTYPVAPAPAKPGPRSSQTRTTGGERAIMLAR